MSGRELKIVFMGTPEFAAYTLQRLVDEGYDVRGVVTVADRQAGRGRQLTPSAVKETVLSVNEVRATRSLMPIALLQPEKLRAEEFLADLRALDADLFIVVAFRMLPEVVWAMPRLGTFNLHASLLPDYRGAAPINYAIINGETKTGVTTFFIDDRIDCGEIIRNVEVEILPSDNAGSLHDKLMTVGADLVLRTVDAIAAGDLSTQSQPKLVGEAKIASKIFKEDCRLDFDASVVDLHNKIRGLCPYPAAWCQINAVSLDDPNDTVKESVTAKIFESHYSTDNQTIAAGTWLTDGRTFLSVRGRDGWLHIDRLQPQSKKPMPIADFLRGWRSHRVEPL